MRIIHKDQRKHLLDLLQIHSKLIYTLIVGILSLIGLFVSLVYLSRCAQDYKEARINAERQLNIQRNTQVSKIYTQVTGMKAKNVPFEKMANEILNSYVSLQQEYKSLSDKCKTTQRNTESLRNNNNKLISDNRQLTAEIKKMKTEYNTLKQEYATLQATNSTLRSNLGEIYQISAQDLYNIGSSISNVNKSLALNCFEVAINRYNQASNYGKNTTEKIQLTQQALNSIKHQKTYSDNYRNYNHNSNSRNYNNRRTTTRY